MPALDAIGLTGPKYEVDIERGKIREFARAMNAPLPDFVEGRTPIIPATFLVAAPYTWGYTLERPRGTVFETIDHDLSVPLHAEESFVFHGEPPRAGDRLIAQATLEDVRVKRGSKGGELTFLTMLTEYRDESGVLKAEQRSMTVTTGQSPDEGEWQVAIPTYDPSYEALDPGDPFAEIGRIGWDDLLEGSGPPTINAGPLLMQDMVRFQGVVGEDNPLHYDITWAAKFGYPFVFGLGMHQASVLASYAAHWLPPSAVRKMRIRFRNVYWPGEQMVYAIKVTRKYIDPDSGHRMADLALSCTRPQDEHLVDAWMTLDFGLA
ncbi:MAG: FAS1-like dehydratase domain-containing protein [Candidatus Promineifilaceae bacterium]